VGRQGDLVSTVGHGFKGTDADGRTINVRGERSGVVRQYGRFDTEFGARMEAGWKYDLS